MSIRRLPAVPASALQEELAAQDVVILYKHSPTCGLCDIAIAEVEQFVAANPTVPVWMVDVLAQRPMSQGIAALLDIEHESPQAILLRHGTPSWHGSHRRVTKVRLEEAMAGSA